MDQEPVEESIDVAVGEGIVVDEATRGLADVIVRVRPEYVRTMDNCRIDGRVPMP